MPCNAETARDARLNETVRYRAIALGILSHWTWVIRRGRSLKTTMRWWNASSRGATSSEAPTEAG